MIDMFILFLQITAAMASKKRKLSPSIDMGILTGLVKQHGLTCSRMPKGVQAKKWKDVTELYNQLVPSSSPASLEILQSQYANISENLPKKQRPDENFDEVRRMVTS